jgi:hypothetical protein
MMARHLAVSIGTLGVIGCSDQSPPTLAGVWSGQNSSWWLVATLAMNGQTISGSGTFGYQASGASRPVTITGTREGQYEVHILISGPGYADITYEATWFGKDLITGTINNQGLISTLNIER